MLSSGVHAHLLKLPYSPPHKKFGDSGRAVAEFQFKEGQGPAPTEQSTRQE
jgi:hypothetical protein